MLHMLPLVAILLASWPLLLVHYILTDFYIISGIIPDALIPTWTAHPSPWAPRSSGFCPCSLLYLIHSPPWCYPRLVLLNLYRAERSPGFLVRCNFKVSRSDMGPEILHFSQAPRWCWCCLSKDHILNKKGRSCWPSLQNYILCPSTSQYLLTATLVAG